MTEKRCFEMEKKSAHEKLIIFGILGVVAIVAIIGVIWLIVGQAGPYAGEAYRIQGIAAPSPAVAEGVFVSEEQPPAEIITTTEGIDFISEDQCYYCEQHLDTVCNQWMGIEDEDEFRGTVEDIESIPEVSAILKNTGGWKWAIYMARHEEEWDEDNKCDGCFCATGLHRPGEGEYRIKNSKTWYNCAIQCIKHRPSGASASWVSYKCTAFFGEF